MTNVDLVKEAYSNFAEGNVPVYWHYSIRN
jgi:hypothetical protein